MTTDRLTPEIKSKILTWIRGAFPGAIGIAALLLFAAGKCNWVWGWAAMIPIDWHIAGIILSIIGWTFFLWAMASNPYFSESVRIQENHQVATSGPYRLVPGIW